MRIILISSSPHKEKSQTYLLAREVIKGCSDFVTSEVIHLCDYRIEFCRHCEACHKKILQCPLNDDVRLILKKMLSAEGIILSSPNYINQVTASMKALFDRASHFIHCKRLLGKYIAGVVSSGSGQNREILDYLKYYAHTCGAQYAGGVSCRAPFNKEKAGEALRLGNKLFTDIKERKEYPAQIKAIEESKKYFGKIIQIKKDAWPEEYNYWKENEWLYGRRNKST